MSELTVRAAREQEYALVGELTVGAFEQDGFLRGPEDTYADKLRDAASRAEAAELLVVVDGADTVLGSVTVAVAGTRFAELAAPGELEFRMLAVAPTARGRGAGEALVRAVVERARERGDRRIVLSSLDRMTTAHRLYERLGFVRLPERDWTPVPEVTLLAYVLEL
jgi:ribosomal protein S18 acetylase RimI-like enzyme